MPPFNRRCCCCVIYSTSFTFSDGEPTSLEAWSAAHAGRWEEEAGTWVLDTDGFNPWVETSDDDAIAVVSSPLTGEQCATSSVSSVSGCGPWGIVLGFTDANTFVYSKMHRYTNAIAAVLASAGDVTTDDGLWGCVIGNFFDDIPAGGFQEVGDAAVDVADTLYGEQIDLTTIADYGFWDSGGTALSATGSNPNGDWTAGTRGGHVGAFGPNAKIRLTFASGDISGFVALFSQSEGGDEDITITAHNAGGATLWSKTVAVEGSPTNGGEFHGVQRDSADIAYIEINSNGATYAVIDDLRFTRAVGRDANVNHVEIWKRVGGADTLLAATEVDAPNQPTFGWDDDKLKIGEVTIGGVNTILEATYTPAPSGRPGLATFDIHSRQEFYFFRTYCASCTTEPELN